MKGNTIKILIAGSRYTGKGQIGREWGQTDADLPTLQPVILYDRNVVHEEISYRVVAWVLSYDPEFQDLRQAFFPNADGIIFTYNITEDPTTSLSDLDNYVFEMMSPFARGRLFSSPRPLLPFVLVGVRLHADKDTSEKARVRGLAWAKTHQIPMIEANFLDKQQFASSVDQAFAALINVILANNKRSRGIASSYKLF
jgi:hypothetical protein